VIRATKGGNWFSQELSLWFSQELNLWFSQELSLSYRLADPLKSQFRSCVKVEGAVLGSLSLISLTVSEGVNQDERRHCSQKFIETGTGYVRYSTDTLESSEVKQSFETMLQDYFQEFIGCMHPQNVSVGLAPINM